MPAVTGNLPTFSDTTGGKVLDSGQAVLGVHVTVDSIAALRANTIANKAIHVAGYYGVGTPGGGVFRYDSTDTTSTDNGGTIIVDAGNRRYKRVLASHSRYNIHDFGAVATSNPATPCTTQVQACIDAIESFSPGPFGGVVVIPASSGARFMVNGGITLNSVGTILEGENQAYSILATGNDSPVVTLNNSQQQLRNLTVVGTNAGGVSFELGLNTHTFGATYPAIQINPGMVRCGLYSVFVTGGFNNILDQGGDGTFEDLGCQGNCYGNGVFMGKGSGWHNRVTLDPSWVGVPAPIGQGTVGAWAANHDYSGNSVGFLVTSQGYYLSLTTPGVSGATAPTLKNYNQTITDNTARWQLAAAQNSACFRADHGAGEYYIRGMDMTGAAEFGFAVSSLGGANTSAYIKMFQGLPSQNILAAVSIDAGLAVYMQECNVGKQADSIRGTVNLTSNFTGQAWIEDCQITGYNDGITLNGGSSGVIISGNQISATTNCVHVAGATVGFVVRNNIHTTAGTGVRVESAASDHYVIDNVILGGGTDVLDAGTGTHKRVVTTNNA